MVDSIPALCGEVDAVMILSLDGRPHLDQAKEVMTFGKPIFVDKPVAANLKDIVQMYVLAEKMQIPLFSASALRWYQGVVEVANAKSTPPQAAISWGPAPPLLLNPS
jgi:predicted dehydrogenase